MRCSEFEQRWQQLLDDRRPLDCDPAAATHQLQCDACRELAETMRQVDWVVGTWQTPSLPEGFADRVAAAAQSELPPRGTLLAGRAAEPTQPASPSGQRDSRSASFTRSLWMALLAAAAVAGVVWTAWPPQADEGPAEPRPGALAGPATAPRLPSEPEVDGELASEFVRAFSTLAAQFPSAEAARAFGALDPVTRPITSSFGTAFDALRRSVPTVNLRPVVPYDKSAGRPETWHVA
jgi:hypothetical protein